MLRIPFFASLGSLLMGYQIGAIGSALLFIHQDFKITEMMSGLIASIIILGTIAGSLTLLFVSNKFAKRRIISIAACISMVSLLVLTLAPTISAILAARFFCGFAIGMVLMIVPIYLADIANKNQRGVYISIFQLSITFGVLLGYGTSFVLAHYANWRAMFAIGLVIAFIQLVASLFLPPAPKHVPIHPQQTDSFWSKRNAKPLMVGLALTVLTHLTGINSVAFFAPQILLATGNYSNTSAILAGGVLMLGNFLSTILAIFVFDNWGRRPVLLFSCLVQAFALITLGFINFTSNPILSIGFLLLYIFGYAMGLGPGAWLVASEIYPLKIRSKAMSLTVIVNNIAAFAVISSFLPLLFSIGKFWVFVLYGLCALLGFIFIFLTLDETKGKSLEEIAG